MHFTVFISDFVNFSLKMTDGGAINWSELLAPEPEPVPVPLCADGTPAAALPLASSAMAVAVADQVEATLQQWAVSIRLFVLLRIKLFFYFFQVGTSDLNLAGDLVEGPKTLLASRAGGSLTSKCFYNILFYLLPEKDGLLRRLPPSGSNMKFMHLF